MFLKNLLWFLEHRQEETCGTPQLRAFFHYLRHGHEEAGAGVIRALISRRVR